jgi:hypothetical protein
MYTSSPGGIALQDYHWSGGFYSPQFLSYDKWGQSEPHELYGFNSNISEMIPEHTYTNQVQQYPIEVKNYDLLETIPKDLILASPVRLDPHKLKASPSPPVKLEKFCFKDMNSKKTIIFLILILLIIYVLDKTIEVYIREASLWSKLLFILVLALLTYFVI